LTEKKIYRVGRKKRVFKWGGAPSRRVSSKLPTWASSMFPTSILNRPRRGRAVLISDALRTSRPKSALGFARTQCANGEKKSELAPRACQTKKGGAFNALGGWLVSTPSAWASKPFWGKKKKPFFGVPWCPFRASALPGRTRAAAVIEWLRVCTSGFFLLRGRGEILLAARSAI
jgi:hypothetical protein